uniref:non-specific serine/threonine protein kinase n=1 Tax=Ananas comosus var. bracteatus TaxID=296719 RepID=A0A6V7QLJ4_ANACO|nr:unnamed protein product [Ananas comosus var. bracteatus]
MGYQEVYHIRSELVLLQILLDLSSNSLSGLIPSNLDKLSALQKLNVSHNDLSDNFNEVYRIGEGGFGSVYKAELAAGPVVAVKCLQVAEPGDVSEINKKSFENEIRALTEVRHRNIVKLHGFCMRSGTCTWCMSIFEKGSLGNVLYSEEEGKKLNWAMRVKVIQGVAHALAYLHHDCTRPIVHRDISVNNILLESEYEPRIADFGTAKLLRLGSLLGHQLQALTAIGTRVGVHYEGHGEMRCVQLRNCSTRSDDGKHPGDLVSSRPSTISSSSDADDLLLKDVLDQRLPPPTGQLAEEVAFIVKVALACTAPPQTPALLCGRSPRRSLHAPCRRNSPIRFVPPL